MQNFSPSELTQLANQLFPLITENLRKQGFIHQEQGTTQNIDQQQQRQQGSTPPTSSR